MNRDNFPLNVSFFEAVEGEYYTVIKVCSCFSGNAQRVVQVQARTNQVYAESTEVLEKVQIEYDSLPVGGEESV